MNWRRRAYVGVRVNVISDCAPGEWSAYNCIVSGNRATDNGDLRNYKCSAEKAAGI